MQVNYRLAAALCIVLFTCFSCKKDAVPTEQDETTTQEITTQTEDQAQVSNSLDAVTLDLNVALESNASIGGRFMNLDSICGASFSVDSASGSKTITITYNGTDCQAAHTRTGMIEISMPAGVRWKDAGAAITVSYKNFKVTRVSDQKSITMNGNYLLTNVSGGLLVQLPVVNTITHSLTGQNLSIAFNDSTTRRWNVARQTVFAFNNGVPGMSVTGMHTDGTQTGIAEWGENRFGHAFSTAITQPLTLSSGCNFRLVSGQVQHNGQLGTCTVSFGLNKDGNPTTCPGTGSYYYKAIWTGAGGKTKTLIAPY